MSNFYFSLSFKGESVPFQEMSGISKGVEVQEPLEDGENRFTYRIPDLSKIKNLKLQRGLVPKDSKLLVWCENITQGVSISSETNDLVVHLLNESGKTMQGWTFYAAFPVKHVLSELRSQSTQVLIDSIEFAYSSFETLETT